MARKKSFVEETHAHFKKLIPIYAAVAAKNAYDGPQSLAAFIELLHAAQTLDRHVVEMQIAAKYGVTASMVMGSMPGASDCDGNCGECTSH